jgi:hypothetical protein
MIPSAEGFRDAGRPEPRSVYAAPRRVESIAECDFYQSVDIPGYGFVEGEIDLRGREHAYLGHVAVAGQRVLEVGTASGILAFHMERQGAEVVAVDLTEDFAWDVVPYAQIDHRRILAERKQGIRRLNNSFWLCHAAFGSRVKVVYSPVYQLPREIGAVDITTFCTVLVHLQNPFLALQRALCLTRKKVIVTEFVWRAFWLAFAASFVVRPSLVFLPDHRSGHPWDTWWFLSPALVVRYLGILGFEKTDVHYHLQRYRGRRALCFTVVGERTRPLDSIDGL